MLVQRGGSIIPTSSSPWAITWQWSIYLCLQVSSICSHNPLSICGLFISAFESPLYLFSQPTSAFVFNISLLLSICSLRPFLYLWSIYMCFRVSSVSVLSAQLRICGPSIFYLCFRVSFVSVLSTHHCICSPSICVSESNLFSQHISISVLPSFFCVFLLLRLSLMPSVTFRSSDCPLVVSQRLTLTSSRSRLAIPTDPLAYTQQLTFPLLDPCHPKGWT